MSSNANARERRASDRRRRRGAEEAPQHKNEEGLTNMSEDAGTTQLPDALKAAASAAVMGAAVGAARAYSNRRHDAAEEEPEERPTEHEEDETEPAPTAETAPSAETAPTAETAPADGAPVEESEREPGAGNGQASGLAAPASRDELREVVAQARRLVEDLRGVDAESVSSATRTPDGWTVGLEVVELHRIPDSTDILASYEIELDEQGSLLRFERVRRYHRSEADRGGN
jgi:hypothetical protein